MSSKYFTLTEHTLPCSYIRNYPRSTIDGSDRRLQLAIKQYTPLDNTSPQPDDVTIIGAHANAFPKELYEPMWDDLYHRLKQSNVRIRAIWIADMAWQGYSSDLNEGQLGNDSSWIDHSLDLLLMVNHFQLPRPIMGIGHSMGGNELVGLSLMHPRLFCGLILIDPVISSLRNKGNFLPAFASSRRRNVWPSRAVAESSFRKAPFYKTWDPRVLELWLTHGLRDDPSTKGQVILRTTRDNEVHSFVRPMVRPPLEKGGPLRPPNRTSHPDFDFIDPVSLVGAPQLYRPEPMMIYQRLPNLRPPVLYIFGLKSELSIPLARAGKMATTGTGPGGSGGNFEGRVKEVLLDVGHLIPMEMPVQTAEASAKWMVDELAIWRKQEEETREEIEAIPFEDRTRILPSTMKMIESAIPQSMRPKSKSKL